MVSRHVLHETGDVYAAHPVAAGEGGLESSMNCRRKVSVGEKLMMFVQCLCGLSVRKIAELFQHSFSTVSVAVNSTMEALLKCKAHLYTKIEPNIVHERIITNSNLYPYFENCIGALDGSHTNLFGVDGAWRNRKAGVSQNVLAV